MKPFNFLQKNKYEYRTGVIWNEKIYSIDCYVDFNYDYHNDVEMILEIYKNTKKTPLIITMIKNDLETVLNGEVIISETDIM